MKEIILTCDICHKKNTAKGIIVKETAIEVIFTTEQTEGKGIAHYLSKERFDCCNICSKKIIKGNYVFASGAQGYNKFWFKGEK